MHLGAASRGRNFIGLGRIVAIVCGGAIAMTAQAQVARTWAGGNGDWFIGANWSPAGVPGALDSVTVASGTPTANGAVTIANLTLSSGLSGTGAVTISGQFLWSGGTLGGTGTTVIAPGATMVATNSYVMLNGGRRLENHGDATISQVVFIANPSVFVNSSDGTMRLSTNSDSLGDAIVRSSNISLPDAEFVNEGTIIKSGATKTSIGANVHFTSSGAIDIQSGTFWISGHGASTGSVTMASGSTLEIRGAFDFPSGPGLAGAGALHARGTTVFGAGTFHPGGQVLFGAGKTTINDDWSPPAGTLSLLGGDIVMNGAFSSAELNTSNSGWTQNGPMTVGTLSATLSGTSINGTASIDHLILNGANLSGAGTVKVEQSLEWSGGGYLFGKLVIEPGATATIPADSLININGILENAGTLNVAGALYLNKAVPVGFTNKAGGVLDISSDVGWADFALSGSTDTVAENYGTINKIGATFTKIKQDTTATFSFHNYGSIHVSGGKLDIHAVGAESGGTTVDAGAELILSATRTCAPGCTLSGEGTLRFEARQFQGTPTIVYPAGSFAFQGDLVVTGGNVTINDPIAPVSATFTGGTTTLNEAFDTPGPLSITYPATVSLAKDRTFPSVELGGTLAGNGTITILNLLTSAGSMKGAGKTILSPACVSTITSGGFDGRAVENSGTASVTGRVQFANGAVLTNKPGATLTVSTDVAAVGSVFYKGSGTASILNQGTLIKSAPVSTTIDTGVFVANTGTIRVLEGTLTIMSPSGALGDVDMSPGASLTLHGNYTINKPLALSGGGRLSLLGTWTNNSTISVDSGFLSLAGQWTNAGTINVSNSRWFIDGTYSSLGTHTSFNNDFTYLGVFPGSLLVADASTGDISLRGFTANGAALKAIEGARFVIAGTVNLNGCSLEGTLSVEQCSTLNVAAGLTFVNSATLRIRNGTCTRTAVQFTGSTAQALSGTGQISIEDTGAGIGLNITTAPALTIGPNVAIRFGDGSPAVGDASFVIGFLKTLINQGSIESLASGRTLSIQSNGSFTNQGVVRADAGNISVNPTTITNYVPAAFSLTGGTWNATNGSLTLGSRSIRTIGAGTDVAVSGASNSIPNLSELALNQGTLRIGGRTLAISPASGTFAQSGFLELGTGGALQVAGAMTAGAASTLRVHVGGIDPGEFGTLTATGAIALDGALRGAFVPPYVPMVDEVVPGVLSSPAISGSFVSVCFDQNPGALGVTPAVDFGSPNLLNLVVGDSQGTPPVILVEPSDSSATRDAVFSVDAAPTDLSYQWRRNGNALTNGPTGTGSVISGSQEATLMVAGVTSGDVGSYDVVVSNSCGTIESAAAVLRICPGDLNNDGFVDDADFVLFIVAYDILDCANPAMPANCPSDLNEDGVVEDMDFQLFVGAYNELVCP